MTARFSWFRVGCASFCVALGALPSSVAHAEPASNVPAADGESAGEAKETAPEMQRWWLLLGSGYMQGLGGSGGPHGIDAGSFVELAVSTEYQLTPDVALGPRLSYGLGIGSVPSYSADDSSANREPSFDYHLWQLGFAGRYQPQPRRGFYLGVGAALADMAASSGYISDSQFGMSLQATAGVDLNVNEHLTLGIELRAVHAEFVDTPQTSLGSDFDGGIPRYGSTTWLALGITGNIPL